MKTTQVTSGRPQSLAAMERKALVDLMKEAPKGSLFTHEQLSAQLKGGDHRRLIPGVSRDLLTYSRVISSVRGIGYRVLLEEEVIGQGPQYVQTLRCVTHRRKERLATVVPQHLTQPIRTLYYQEVSRAAVLHTVLSEDVMRRLPSKLPAANTHGIGDLSGQQVARAFASLKF